MVKYLLTVQVNQVPPRKGVNMTYNEMRKCTEDEWEEEETRFWEKMQRSQQQQMFMLKIVFIMLIVPTLLQFVTWITPGKTIEKTEKLSISQLQEPVKEKRREEKNEQIP